MSEPFSVDDLSELTVIVGDALRSGLDRDWAVPAGTLEWSCWETADHMIDCVFSYALFFASRRQESYPPFGELHALPDATPRDLVEGLQAVCTMLDSVVRTAEPDARAVIFRRPTVETGRPRDFAARGALEMILHTHDICRGLGVAFDPPDDLCLRLRDHTQGWPGHERVDSTSDPWADLLERSGRSY